MNIRKLIFFLRERLFPAGCAVCKGLLLGVDEAWYGLCGICRARLEAGLCLERGETHCSRCGRPLISETGACLSCRGAIETAREAGVPPSGPDRIAALFPYAGDYKKVLRAYKFGRSLGAGHFLAEQLLRAMDRLFGEELRAPVLVPVPPRPGKIRTQGWDQIECLARGLEKERPLRRCLKRLPSRSQKELDKAGRSSNLRGRILARGEAPAEAVLFDDVITTGATLDACAAPLREAGARKVYGICLFYD
jgi:ComF family protein